jgi:mannosyltransferase
MLTHVDAVHGTYYLGLHFWVAVFGASPFSLRLPSAIAVGAATVGLYLLARMLGPERVAVVCAIVFIVLPRTTYMGEEARSFAFSAAIVTWLTLVLVALIRRRGHSRPLWIVYGVLLATGTYIFLYVALFAVVHAILLVACRRRSEISRPFVRSWLKSTGWALLAAVPLVAVAFLERDQIAYLATKPQLGFSTLTVSLWFGNPEFAIVAWAVMIVGVALAGAALVRALRRHRENFVEATGDPSTQSAQSAPPEVALPWEGAPDGAPAVAPALETVGLLWLLVPALVLVGGQVIVPDFTARYLSYCAPAVALVIGGSLNRLVGKRPRALALLTALVVVAAVPAYLGQREPYSKNNSDWAEISAALAARAQPGQGVVFDEHASPSHRTRLAFHTYPAGFTGLRDVTLDVPYTRNSTWYDKAYTVGQANALGRFTGINTVWLIEYSAGRSTDTYGMQPLRDIGYTLTRTIREHSSVIYEYSR